MEFDGRMSLWYTWGMEIRRATPEDEASFFTPEAAERASVAESVEAHIRREQRKRAAEKERWPEGRTFEDLTTVKGGWYDGKEAEAGHADGPGAE